MNPVYKNIFPNSFDNNALFIFEEKTRGGSINPDDLKSSSYGNHFIVPADGQPRWVYIMFQALNTRWRVTGARIVDKGDFHKNSPVAVEDPGWDRGWVTGADVPLLGEKLPGEPVVATLEQDILLRDKLSAAFLAKKRATGSYSSFSEDFPVYVVRYRLRGRTTADYGYNDTLYTEAGSLDIAVVARTVVEPSLSSFRTSVTSTNPVTMGARMNRVAYGSSGANHASILYLRFVAP